MGGRRLPQQKAVKPGFTTLLLLCVLSVAACRGGSGAEEPTASSSPTAASPAVTVTVTPSPTPDPLARLPESQPEAVAWTQHAIDGASPGTCPAAVSRAAGACVMGEATGDGKPDVALLLPVKGASSTTPHGAAVFIWSSQTQKLAAFAEDLTADASSLGLAFFHFVDRTGDGRADLSFVQNICGATGCSSRAVILAWDGTAWRDVGPGDSVANIDLIAWKGEGAKSTLSVHGGKLPPTAPTESGPTRASTTTYALAGGRFAAEDVQKDPPEYLYHAVEDADDAFDEDMATSAAAFRISLTLIPLNPCLKSKTLFTIQRRFLPARPSSLARERPPSIPAATSRARRLARLTSGGRSGSTSPCPSSG